MLFKLKENRVVILGLNNISLNLARILSINRDVIILYNTKSKKLFNYNIDVIIEQIGSNLVDQLSEYLSSGHAIFISLTGDNEYNIFTAQLAKKLGAERCIAGVNNNDYFKINLDFVLIFNPLQLILDKINSLLKNNRFQNIKILIPGKLNITQLEVTNNDHFSYCKLENINLKDGIIIAIKRRDRIFIVDKNIKILPGDILFILYKKNFTGWLNFFAVNKKNKNKLFIVGSDITGRYFIDYWQDFFASVIIIEPELKKCNNLAIRFEKPHILHSDATDLQLLREEGINKKSVFIACSSNDNYNLLSSYGALSLGCNQVITILSKEENREIAKYLKLKTVIFKAEIVSNYIVSLLKTGFKKIDKYILDRKIYTLEIEIKKNSRVENMKLKDLELPEEVIIGAIIRKEKTIIPATETKLKDKDVIIVFFNKKMENKINDIFS